MTSSSTNYDEIIYQLKQFGYNETEIIEAINVTMDKRDINQIVEIMEKSQQNKQNAFLNSEMKTEVVDQKEEDFREVTINDIKNMSSIDEDLILKYRNQQMKITNNELVKIHDKLITIEKNEGKFSKQWNAVRLEELNKQLSVCYTNIEIDSYESETTFNQQEMMQLAQKAKKTVNNYCKQIVEIEKKAETENEASIKKKVLFDELDEKINSMRFGMKKRKSKKIYAAWKEAILKHPKKISMRYNVEQYERMLKWAEINKPEEFKELLGRLADLFDESFEMGEEKLHKFLVFQLSTVYDKARPESNDKEEILNRIRDEVCSGVNLLRPENGGNISDDTKHFLKFILCFQNELHYKEMLYSSQLIMDILRKPLDIEYKRLENINSNILSLKLNKYDKLENIDSSHNLLEWDYNQWYKPKTAMFWPNDLKPLINKWKSLGLNITDPEFTQIRKFGIINQQKSYVTSEDLAMEYLNLIAYKLDGSFQKIMKELFKENRINLGLKYPPKGKYKKDLGVQSGPVKTKSRQLIKIKLKYFDSESPKCMSVLDIVRNGIVCQDDIELCNLFELIMKKFSGNIIRVKNAFDDISKGDDSYGYRAVMINLAFGDEKILPKGYKMVVETQLLLNKYYQIRKNMHLGYGICRSKDGGSSTKKKPSYVLAQDSCKLGQLDV